MPRFKERVLDIIRRDRVSSIPEISRRLGISKTAIQYHIQNLLQEDLIEEALKVPTVSIRGRPIKYFQLSARHRPDNYALLTDILLSSYLRSISDQHSLDEKLLEIARSVTANMEKENSFIRRIENCMVRLDQLNYQPHWEVMQQGSQITLGNCPYAKILPSHPELCRLDQFILQSMLNLPVQVNSLWKDHPEINSGCEFFFNR